MSTRVLLLGSGGREHALAWKMAQSTALEALFCLPGNPGTALYGQNIDGDPHDRDTVLQAAKAQYVDLIVIGPETPLAGGVSDAARAEGFPVFGPSRAAAQIESSKAFAKTFMERHSIPTARFRVFSDHAEASEYAAQAADPIVIKASGLAAGKGVLVPESVEEALAALDEIMLKRRFGEAGDQVIIEERLEGREVSILAFTDGLDFHLMPAAQDHKRLLEGDRGPNTGGMGVFAPSPFADEVTLAKVQCEVIAPAVRGLHEEGMPFVGVLYAGIILTAHGPKVLEFNCRFGDPETQVILPLLEGDLIEVMLACTQGSLKDLSPRIRWRKGATVCVILASDGYPGSYPRGREITGLDSMPEQVLAFHAGTRVDQGRVVTHGGRVLGITAYASDMVQARERAYAGVEQVKFHGMQYRNDIAEGVEQSRQEDRSGHSAYAAAGVIIERGDEAVRQMKVAVEATYGPEVLSNVGSFGGLYSAHALKGMWAPILVASTDGVGTKVMLAVKADLLEGLGHDIVNHCINDILVQGARPLFFLDYIASDHLEPAHVRRIVEGMAAACSQAGCALLGGETAEMPGVYAVGQHDIAGMIVGLVEREDLLPREDIESGDLLLGMASSGPHTNGFSLIRHIFRDEPLDVELPELGTGLAGALLAPHRSYHELLTDSLQAPERPIKALAHITGGGFFGNIPRVLPDGFGAEINTVSWPVPPIFDLIQRRGKVSIEEMHQVFNMGIGMVAVIAPKDLEKVQSLIGETIWVVGRVVQGRGVQLQ